MTNWLDAWRCSHCRRSFYRPEFLRKHILSISEESRP